MYERRTLHSFLNPPEDLQKGCQPNFMPRSSSIPLALWTGVSPAICIFNLVREQSNIKTKNWRQNKLVNGHGSVKYLCTPRNYGSLPELLGDSRLISGLYSGDCASSKFWFCWQGNNKDFWNPVKQNIMSIMMPTILLKLKLDLHHKTVLLSQGKPLSWYWTPNLGPSGRFCLALHSKQQFWNWWEYGCSWFGS